VEKKRTYEGKGASYIYPLQGIYDIPLDWSSEKLGEVIQDLQSAFASGLRDDNGITQLRMNNITSDGRLNFEELLKVPIPSGIEDFNLQQDDVIFNNTPINIQDFRSVISDDKIFKETISVAGYIEGWCKSDPK
jgi:hypothetical protein